MSCPICKASKACVIVNCTYGHMMCLKCIRERYQRDIEFRGPLTNYTTCPLCGDFITTHAGIPLTTTDPNAFTCHVSMLEDEHRTSLTSQRTSEIESLRCCMRNTMPRHMV